MKNNGINQFRNQNSLQKLDWSNPVIMICCLYAIKHILKMFSVEMNINEIKFENFLNGYTYFYMF